MIEKLLKQEGSSWWIDDEDCSWESKADYLYTKILPSCGCSDPASIGKYVKDMFLKHVKQTLDDMKDTFYWNNNSYDDLPLMFFLSWADREGYIEHGTTIRCSWMTKKGDELLKDLEIVEKEEELKGKDNHE